MWAARRSSGDQSHLECGKCGLFKKSNNATYAFLFVALPKKAGVRFTKTRRSKVLKFKIRIFHVILHVLWVFVYEQAVIDVLPCSFGACKKRERCLLMSLPAVLSMAVNCICTKHEHTICRRPINTGIQSIPEKKLNLADCSCITIKECKSLVPVFSITYSNYLSSFIFLITWISV